MVKDMESFLLSLSEVARHILHEVVDYCSWVIISSMLHLLIVHNTNPEVVLVELCLKNWNRSIGVAELGGNSTKGTITQIYSPVFSGNTAFQGFSSLEWMNVVLVNSHNFVHVEIWNPMEEPIDKCLWIDIEIFTTTVHRDVIVCKLDFIFRSFEGIDHELFLESAL